MAGFQAYDELRVFITVAHYQSFTAAAEALNLTKGAVSYLIKQLERELGFSLFVRQRSGITLTPKGKQLWEIANRSFLEIEREIRTLSEETVVSITVGTSTYFASRWLSSRLMSFISQYPHIRLRLQPVIGPGNLKSEQLDLMIRWGTGDWQDVPTKRLFSAPAFATAGRTIAQQIKQDGLAQSLPHIPLLHDREGSPAWRDWYTAAGIPYRLKQDSLVINDPNVRVQAVINGQGIALNDELVDLELQDGRLVQISPVELVDYGYFYATLPDTEHPAAVASFCTWLEAEAQHQHPHLANKKDGLDETVPSGSF